MTEARFYLELAKMPAAGWEVWYRRAFYDSRKYFLRFWAPPEFSRPDHRLFCPITAVCAAKCHQSFRDSEVTLAARMLGLSQGIKERLVKVSDGAGCLGLTLREHATGSRLLTALNITDHTVFIDPPA